MGAHYFFRCHCACCCCCGGYCCCRLMRKFLNCAAISFIHEPFLCKQKRRRARCGRHSHSLSLQPSALSPQSSSPQPAVSLNVPDAAAQFSSSCSVLDFSSGGECAVQKQGTEQRMPGKANKVICFGYGMLVRCGWDYRSRLGQEQ